MTLRTAKSQEKRRNQPQNHSVAQGAHRQVHEPILVEVQLPVEAAAEILEAGSQLRGSDSLGSGKRKLGLDPVGPEWAGPPTGKYRWEPGRSLFETITGFSSPQLSPRLARAGPGKACLQVVPLD